MTPINFIPDIGCLQHRAGLLCPISFLEPFTYFFLAFCQFLVDILIHSKRLSLSACLVVENSIYTLLAGVSNFFCLFYRLLYACFGIRGGLVLPVLRGNSVRLMIKETISAYKYLDSNPARTFKILCQLTES